MLVWMKRSCLLQEMRKQVLLLAIKKWRIVLFLHLKKSIIIKPKDKKAKMHQWTCQTAHVIRQVCGSLVKVACQRRTNKKFIAGCKSYAFLFSVSNLFVSLICSTRRMRQKQMNQHTTFSYRQWALNSSGLWSRTTTLSSSSVLMASSSLPSVVTWPTWTLSSILVLPTTR